jgi:hypothetical protein
MGMTEAAKRILEAVAVAAASALATWGVDEVRRVVEEKRQATAEIPKKAKRKKKP